MQSILIALFVAILWAPAAFAQEADVEAKEQALTDTAGAPEIGIDAMINEALRPIADVVSSIIFYSVSFAGTSLPLVVTWLVIGATFFTLYFGFINVRGFAQALRLIRGDYANPNDAGEVSHFQALATALSGTVGVGNIGAVAVLITLGGPGASFWMIVAGLLGMSTKFVECTLGVKYRNYNPDGSVSGGPMYYMSKGLAELGMPRIGKAIAVFFAVAIIVGGLGIGNMFQANQAYIQFVNVTGGKDSFFADKGWLFGLITAIVLGAVIIGGIKSIARVTDKLVPFMAIFYVTFALIVIGIHYDEVPAAFGLMFRSAFSPEGITGGVIGVVILGFQQAVFSNEAGLGSSPIAHSAVRTKEPITEGLVALLEPFVDTVVICTITALVILVTLYDPSAMAQMNVTGVAMTSAAFATTISWFPYPLAVAVILFAISTQISWSYYGLKGWTYLFGENRVADLSYKAIFCVFAVIGCTVQLGPLLDLSDALVFAMAVPNILVLYLLAPTVKRELNSYFARVTSGEIVNYRELRRQRERAKPV